MSNVKTKKIIIPLTAFFFILALLQVVLGVGNVLRQRELIDFSVYYQYTKLFLNGGNPYLIAEKTPIPLNYPPSFLLFFSPFTFLSQFPAQIFFTLTSLAALLYASNFLLCFFRFPLPVRLLLLSLLLQNFPTKFTLVLGQVNLIILFLVVLSWLSCQKRQQVISGLFWGLSILIKPLTLPLFLYFLIKKKFTTIITASVLIVITNCLMIFLFPYLGAYLSERLPYLFSQTATVANLYDQSLRAFLIRIGVDGYLYSIVTAALLYIAAIINYLRQKGGFDSKLRDLTFFSLILAITTAGSSFTWQHHLVFLFPGFIAETIYFLRSKSTIRGIILATSATLVGYHFPDIAHPPTTNPIFISHSLIGTLILIGLLLTHRKSIKRRI
jgi:hypothetical protein